MSSAFSRILRVGAALCVIVASSLGQTRSAANPTFHWCVTGEFRDRVDLSGTPIRDNAVIFYEHDFGLIPRFYKGQAERGGVPQAVDMNAHLAKVRADIESRIPDPQWSGYGIIDLETWGPLWEYTVEAAHDLSRSIARKNHPTRTAGEIERIARANYELGSRSLLEKTLGLCKALRPRAKWGMYAWPYLAHGPNIEKLSWLWDASTAFFPECYTVYKGAAGGQHQKGYAPPEEYLADNRAKVELHRRVAGRDKPVIALVWVRYHEINPVFGGQFLAAEDLDRMIRTPLEAGADGLVFWDAITTPAVADEYRGYLADRLVPALRR
ncbi:MAG: hypothetical protein JNK58_04795 [Phycisphaerae bacterium]|nr:hypothetical protein [Phycisphaerae bacterium]